MRCRSRFNFAFPFFVVRTGRGREYRKVCNKSLPGFLLLSFPACFYINAKWKKISNTICNCIMQAKRIPNGWIVKYILNCEWVARGWGGWGCWFNGWILNRIHLYFLIKLLYSHFNLFVVTFSHTIWGINYMQLWLLSPFNSMLLCFYECFMPQLILLAVG